MSFDSTANLLFTIGADTADAEENIQRFRGLLSKDLSDIQGEFSDWATKIFGDLTSVSGAMTALTASLAAGVVAVGTALYELGEKEAKYAEEIEKGTHVTGLNAEQMSALRYAAKNTGLGYEELVGSLAKFSRAVAAAQDPNSQQADSFHRIGVQQQDIVKGGTDLLYLLNKTVDGFKNSADNTLKTAAARDLFSRSGQQMIEFLNLGSEGLKQFDDRAKELGLTLGKEDTEAAKGLHLEVIQLKAIFEGLALSIGKDVVPYLEIFAATTVAVIKTIQKQAEIAANAKSNWWNAVIPGKDYYDLATQSLGTFSQEFTKEIGDLQSRIHAAMAKEDAPSILPPLLPPPDEKSTEVFYGLSSIFEQVKDKAAGATDEIRKIFAEGSKLDFQIGQATERFQKLRGEGKLTSETVQRELKALQALPGEVAAYTLTALQELDKKRAQAVIQSTDELQKKLAGMQEQTYDNQRAGVEAEIALLTQKLTKEKTLTQENANLIEAIREASLNKINRAQLLAFEQELLSLQKELASTLQARMTTEERLKFSYDQDLQHYSQVEEQKAMLTAKTEGERQAIHIQFAMNRQALDDKYGADLQKLHNSQGWQGIFGAAFAQNIRGNEALLREWSESAHQSLMLVQVAMESLKEMSQQAFDQFAQGMGQNIAQALVYQTSIGDAMRAATAAALESLAGRAIGEAIYSAALGFLCLAEGDFAGAASAFEAAALFGSVGTVSAVVGRAVAPSQGSSKASAGVAGSSASTGSSATSPASSGSSGPAVIVNVYGHVIGNSGAGELADILNEAVVGRDVRLIATQVKQTTPVVQG